MPANDPNERRIHGRYMALKKWANTDPVQGTAAARKAGPGSLDYWLAHIDPDRLLSDAERLRRADLERRAYFVGLARKSAKVRRRRAAKPTNGPKNGGVTA